MPVRFSRLRIAGFKSFAEPATVDILPGLTGIVGPNGCGKSNVVEALRWAMGESSARSLRGGEMEDVIFSGTAGRPSRNIAEVGLVLHDTQGVAPPPFTELGEIEIVRRIERGAGSAYRVNGKEVRARDVQTLFADLASGARASAMVSQGRVGALVGARPEERRAVLEEAAGITGLHARRHEAELKLRQAEANLSRAEDLKGQLDTQLAALKRQARQASRYRNLSSAIRQAEAELLSVQRARVERARDTARAAVATARSAVAQAEAAARSARAGAEELAAALPGLREAETEARTALERRRIAGEQIAAEEGRARAALAEAERRAAQIAKDVAHAEQASRDAGAAEERLAAEEHCLAEAEAAHPARAEAAERKTVEAEDAARAAEVEANRATEAAAEAQARTQAAAQRLHEVEARAQRATEQLDHASQERDRIRAQSVDPDQVAAAEREKAAAEEGLDGARAAQEASEQARVRAQAALAEARARLSAAETARAKLAAEARALAEVLAVKDGERWPPMVDAVSVPAGLEAALGAALGEELTSAADPDAARHWRTLPPLDPPALPGGAQRLSDLIHLESKRIETAPLAPKREERLGEGGTPDQYGAAGQASSPRPSPPPSAAERGSAALSRALSYIGLVADDAAGDAAQGLLAPGQMVVSAAGALWRWDGYTIRAGTPTEAAVRLRQRNRLNALRADLTEAEARAAEAGTSRHAAEAAEREANAAEQHGRQARREAEQRVERARAAAAQLRAQADSVAARLSVAEQQVAALTPEQREAARALEEAREAQAALPDIAGLRAAVEQARAALSSARAAESAARAERDGVAREGTARSARRAVIARERKDWRERAADAASRVADLTARGRDAEQQRAALEAAPGRFAEAKAEAQAALVAAEAAHRRAAEALAGAAGQATRAEREARAAEANAGAAREAAVRAEAEVEQADHAWGTVAERVLGRLGANPALPEPPETCDAEAEEKARCKFERLVKEREEMGPVNLRAEIEVVEIERQIATIDAEHAEISTAVAKLRGSIGHLNREGRERLAQVFVQVDQHFQALFARMFSGGRAHLALVGSDDPLQAGLEIYAQPPGKKLSALSLLSGGEQALTALSLVFAVFRCNPAPICVLDEVDAPLDDANVDRFCALLDDMVRETGTRFLVVTHHPLTMARMDRLYGVTMQERGISRLLSVDLRSAERLAEPERMAAE